MSALSSKSEKALRVYNYFHLLRPSPTWVKYRLIAHVLRDFHIVCANARSCPYSSHKCVPHDYIDATIPLKKKCESATGLAGRKQLCIALARSRPHQRSVLQPPRCYALSANTCDLTIFLYNQECQATVTIQVCNIYELLDAQPLPPSQPACPSSSVTPTSAGVIQRMPASDGNHD
jgi:hypothetical protein